MKSLWCSEWYLQMNASNIYKACLTCVVLNSPNSCPLIISRVCCNSSVMFIVPVWRNATRNGKYLWIVLSNISISCWILIWCYPTKSIDLLRVFSFQLWILSFSFLLILSSCLINSITWWCISDLFLFLITWSKTDKLRANSYRFTPDNFVSTSRLKSSGMKSSQVRLQEFNKRFRRSQSDLNYDDLADIRAK